VNRQALAVLWILVTLDGALMGYRLAMGRSALLDKRRYHQRRSLGAAVAAQPALIAVTVFATGLIAAGPADTAAAFNDAVARLLVVAVPYATCILATTALCLVPSVAVRTAASIIIFGPFSLARPLVVIGAVAYAVLPDPRWPLVLVGFLVLVPGIFLEPCLDRQISATVLLPLATGDRRSSGGALATHAHARSRIEPERGLVLAHGGQLRPDLRVG